jgi:hypothetical protein
LFGRQLENELPFITAGTEVCQKMVKAVSQINRVGDILLHKVARVEHLRPIEAYSPKLMALCKGFCGEDYKRKAGPLLPDGISLTFHN